MSFAVRLYGHKGMVQTTIVDPHQVNLDNALMLTQPYQWAQNLTVSASPVLSAVNSPDVSTLVLVEIPTGQAVRYEINSPTRSVAASANSPILAETSRLPWNQGWQLSIMDAAGT